MGLEIKGSVKQGTKGVTTRVKLQIKEKGTQINKWEYDVTTLEDGTFYHQIQDATGKYFDYKDDTLHAAPRDTRFKPQEQVIRGTSVDLNFWIEPEIEPVTRLFERLIGAALLNRETYARMAAEENALPQALLVAVIACIAFGAIVGSRLGLMGVVFIGLLVLVSWAVAVALTYWIGTTVLAVEDTSTTFDKYLHPVGFAATPLLAGAIILTLLLVLGAAPWLLNVLFVVVLLWEIVAVTAAVRVALSYGKQWWRAFVVVLLPPIVAFVIFLFVAPR